MSVMLTVDSEVKVVPRQETIVDNITEKKKLWKWLVVVMIVVIMIAAPATSVVIVIVV